MGPRIGDMVYPVSCENAIIIAMVDPQPTCSHCTGSWIRRPIILQGHDYMVHRLPIGFNGPLYSSRPYGFHHPCNRILHEFGQQQKRKGGSTHLFWESLKWWTLSGLGSSWILQFLSFSLFKFLFYLNNLITKKILFHV
jgi:hypothetical protein